MTRVPAESFCAEWLTALHNGKAFDLATDVPAEHAWRPHAFAPDQHRRQAAAARSRERPSLQVFERDVVPSP
ncbi:hypothetical protein Pmi06nite_82120 [Planotetraspora mira]|uniref:Uncharacterized protein n=1 Tax=Planotetraspora mira TaxID=58121 RepID=A0A8J3U923_9ACTN|nr:hypothetical protein Pmi06nite_82120 [Planotetraspora mira]